MQFSNLITILTVAMTAAALPAADIANTNALVVRTGGGGGTPINECSQQNEKPLCCNTTGILNILSCVIGVVGGTCSGVVKCCNVPSAPGSFNINILTCGII
ncbi:hypothetical protein B0T21DRAFT_381582 [Apiosordaria backusii]|uniref:Hydrophobin n=1 Tax=Apiosordaria backusii TaxID=314023 RepID=A0AA40ELY4_9PEZI|nr:hypothetical protein B0T21DRAFT_381582 [Apiosordaria backusii]